MGWSIGFDSKWQRDIGYGVPAVCDHPDCNEKIDRGLSYVCCNAEPFGGEGCGLYFCFAHSNAIGQCQCCDEGGLETFTPKPDVPEWINHKLTDESWAQWRSENPDWVAAHSKDVGQGMLSDKILHDTSYGRAAMKKFGDVPDNFVIFEAGWQGYGGPATWDNMVVKGAEFRAPTRGKNKGKLTIKIPNTERICTVTKKEMQDEKEPL